MQLPSTQRPAMQHPKGDYKNLLDKDEIAVFMHKSDTKALWMVLTNWVLIACAFALPAWDANLLTVLASLILLGNRQLGLGILMHDCAHSSLFATRKYNQWVGQWLCAAPILADLNGYRKYHLKHHKEAGTTNDPDYPNYKNYPVTQKSLSRKIIRDLTGLTGLKTLYAVLLMHGKIIEYDMSYQKSDAQALPIGAVIRNILLALLPGAVIHMAIVTVLTLCDAAFVYPLWWVAFLTTNMLFARIRNSAEHANVPDLLAKDPRLHARTTYASWWERLTFAPNHVNYHLEHHWVPTVPPYHLAGFHRYLLQKGYLEGAEVLNGYTDVLRRMSGMAIKPN